MSTAAQIHYFSFQHGIGEGLPVVLLHGAGGNHLSWPLEIRRLPGHQVDALDLPGHGKSEGQGLRSIDAYVNAILGWMDALGKSRVVFVGHSMGSAVALMLAYQHPHRVAALGLVGAGARLRVHPDLLAQAASPENCDQVIAMIAAWSYSSAANPRLIELATRRMHETRPGVLYGDLLACNAFDLTEQVSSIRQPTLLLCGADDRMTPPRYAHFLSEAIPSARLEVIPSAGHMLMLEQPQVVAATLSRFLLDVSLADQNT